MSRADLAARARDEIETRFIHDGSGIVLDYVPPPGAGALPSIEDLSQGRPNALAWWTPGENGAFFTGIHLLGLTRAARAGGDTDAAARARRAAGAVTRLATVGQLPGFVARMVGDDLTTHPPYGSDDQTFPALLGLWAYGESDLAPDAERAQLRTLILGSILALRDHRWRVPADDGRGGYRGTFAEASFTAAARLLCLVRIAELVSGDPEWTELGRSLLDEPLAELDGRTRRELLRGGCAYGHLGSPKIYPHHPPFWTSGTAQLALRVLWETEEDADARTDYAAGLRATAQRALPHVSLLHWEPGMSRIGFDAHWRRLLPLWRPQLDVDDAVRLGEQQSALWENGSPGKVVEDFFVREPAWAALVVALSPDPGHSARLDELLGERGDIDLSRTATSGFLPLALVDGAPWVGR